MDKHKIQKTIQINAPVAKVWSVFTDPRLTRQMGGEYVTNWQVGDSFGWKGKDGQMYTNGQILEIETERLIKHNLIDMSDSNSVLSIITYKLSPNEEQTTIDSEEYFNREMSEEELEDAQDGWDFALAAVKDIAEQS